MAGGSRNPRERTVDQLVPEARVRSSADAAREPVVVFRDGVYQLDRQVSVQKL